MYSPFKMKGKSPMMKALVGKQNNLPAELKAKIEAAPESPAKMKKASPSKMKKKSSMKMMKKSPAKQTIDPNRKENESVKKNRKESDNLAKTINKTYLDGGGSYNDTKSKTGKLMTQFDKGIKNLDKQKTEVSKKNKAFRAGMDNKRKEMGLDNKTNKKNIKKGKGTLSKTPKTKTTAQKVKTYVGKKLVNFAFGTNL